MPSSLWKSSNDDHVREPELLWPTLQMRRRRDRGGRKYEFVVYDYVARCSSSFITERLTGLADLQPSFLYSHHGRCDHRNTGNADSFKNGSRPVA